MHFSYIQQPLNGCCLNAFGNLFLKYGLFAAMNLFFSKMSELHASKLSIDNIVYLKIFLNSIKIKLKLFYSYELHWFKLYKVIIP